jgi:hypothetical protein
MGAHGTHFGAKTLGGLVATTTMASFNSERNRVQMSQFVHDDPSVAGLML